MLVKLYNDTDLKDTFQCSTIKNVKSFNDLFKIVLLLTYKTWVHLYDSTLYKLEICKNDGSLIQSFSKVRFETFQIELHEAPDTTQSSLMFDVVAI